MKQRRRREIFSGFCCGYLGDYNGGGGFPIGGAVSPESSNTGAVTKALHEGKAQGELRRGRGKKEEGIGGGGGRLGDEGEEEKQKRLWRWRRRGKRSARVSPLF